MRTTIFQSAAAVVLSLGLASGAALAADAPRGPDVVQEVVAPPPAPLWSGGYLGASGGFSFGNDDGWMLGIFGGYNWQDASGLVLGAEGDLFWADIDPSVDFLGSARARLGFAMDRAHIYATGGLAFSDDDVGWALGGGVEAMFTRNMFGRAEYVYHDVGAADVHAVRVGLGWLFNSGY